MLIDQKPVSSQLQCAFQEEYHLGSDLQDPQKMKETTNSFKQNIKNWHSQVHFQQSVNRKNLESNNNRRSSTMNEKCIRIQQSGRTLKNWQESSLDSRRGQSCRDAGEMYQSPNRHYDEVYFSRDYNDPKNNNRVFVSEYNIDESSAKCFSVKAPTMAIQENLKNDYKELLAQERRKAELLKYRLYLSDKLLAQLQSQNQIITRQTSGRVNSIHSKLRQKRDPPCSSRKLAVQYKNPSLIASSSTLLKFKANTKDTERSSLKSHDKLESDLQPTHKKIKPIPKNLKKSENLNILRTKNQQYLLQRNGQLNNQNLQLKTQLKDLRKRIGQFGEQLRRIGNSEKLLNTESQIQKRFKGGKKSQSYKEQEQIKELLKTWNKLFSKFPIENESTLIYMN